jgi:Ca2+-binding RTX toxin-like protein
MEPQGLVVTVIPNVVSDGFFSGMSSTNYDFFANAGARTFYVVQDGNVIWQKSATYPTMILGTDAGIVYVGWMENGYSPGALEAYNFITGELLWTRSIGNDAYFLKSDAEGNLVFSQNDSFAPYGPLRLIKVNKDTGEEIWSAYWSAEPPYSATSPVAVGADGYYISTNGPRDVIKYDVNGAEVWRSKITTDSNGIFEQDGVVVAVGIIDPGFNTVITKLDGTTGSIISETVISPASLGFGPEVYAVWGMDILIHSDAVYVSGILHTDPTVNPALGTGEAFVSKFSLLMEPIWTYSFGGDGADGVGSRGTSLSVDANGMFTLFSSSSGSTSVEGVALQGDPNFIMYSFRDAPGTLIGTAQADNVFGSTGNDAINTGAGNDIVDAGAGNDLIVGGSGAGNDIYRGGLGEDTVKYTSALAGIVVNLVNGTASSRSGVDAAGIGNDTLSGIENVIAGSFDDLISGDALANVLEGMAGNDSISGLGGDDTLTGDSGADTLIGGAGNDSLDGGAGNDVLMGGDGIDTASYASATAAVTVSLALTTAQNTGTATGRDTLTTIENLSGSGFNDVLTGSAAANRINGGAGNDVIDGGAGIDTLDGGEDSDIYLLTVLGNKTAVEIADSGTSGTDELRFAATTAGTLTLLAGDTGIEWVVIGTGTGAAAVATATTALNINAAAAANGLTIVGNAGGNTLTGSAFADTIDGGAGNDVLIAGAGNDSISGGAGNDTINDGIGTDTINGGDGVDTLRRELSADYGFTFTAVVNLAEGKFYSVEAAEPFDTLISIENVDMLGSFDDILIGSSAANQLSSGGGNDSLYGADGNDTLIGGAGNDSLDGGTGNDVLTGGQGIDTVSYASATAAVTVSLALTTAQNTGTATGRDTLTTIENLTGSGFNDVLTGSAAANRINGGAGNDVIDGGAGIDTLDGGEDSDIYLLTVLGNKTAVEIADSGTSGTDELRFAATTAGTLTLLAGDTGIERVVIGTGTAAAAVATATTALNVNAASAANALTIIGNAGINTLTGTSSSDSIDGAAGNDILLGGAGNDTLIGGNGNDVLTGGLDSDVFVFNFAPNATTNRDTITDFVSANDDIWLARSTMTGLGPVGAIDSADFRSGAGITTAGDATDRVIYNTSTGALFYDADGLGGAAAVQFAQLNGNPALSFSDILII